MANSPNVVLRVPPELIDAARARVDDPDIPVSVLLRAGLGVLAGHTYHDALSMARMQRGPKPGASREAAAISP
jgi:hypothetical protein